MVKKLEGRSLFLNFYPFVCDSTPQNGLGCKQSLRLWPVLLRVRLSAAASPLGQKCHTPWPLPDTRSTAELLLSHSTGSSAQLVSPVLRDRPFPVAPWGPLDCALVLKLLLSGFSSQGFCKFSFWSPYKHLEASIKFWTPAGSFLCSLTLLYAPLLGAL